MIEAFPEDTAPRWLLRDRDGIYGDVVRHGVASMGIGEVVSAPSSPWQNPYAERIIGSIRRECLNELRERAVRLVFDQAHDHPSQWAPIRSVAEKLGCTVEALRRWVRQAKRDGGKRPGLTA